LIVPSASLNEEAIFRTFVLHAIVPIIGILTGLFHMVTLHEHKYSAGGGFKRLTVFFRFRETRRWSYASRYWSRASGTWIRILLSFLYIRVLNDLFVLARQVVGYGFMNMEYWPISENIDFVLIIPHWYLRPLMGALVAIPHHYLGFIYIGIFFGLVINMPWTSDQSEDSIWQNQDPGAKTPTTTPRWDWTHFTIAVSFFFGAIFTTAIIPTGKYFIACGSMDGLVFSYWVLIGYLLGLGQIALFMIRKFWSLNNSD
jgi:hypothetical protein